MNYDYRPQAYLLSQYTQRHIVFGWLLVYSLTLFIQRYASVHSSFVLCLSVCIVNELPIRMLATWTHKRVLNTVIYKFWFTFYHEFYGNKLICICTKNRNKKWCNQSWVRAFHSAKSINVRKWTARHQKHQFWTFTHRCGFTY